MACRGRGVNVKRVRWWDWVVIAALMVACCPLTYFVVALVVLKP